jgi:signal peptidase II
MINLNLNKRTISYFAIFIIGVILDQLSKFWAIKYLQPINSYPIIKNVFHLTYRENNGAAFSILQGMIPFFVIVNIVVTILIIYIIASKKVTNIFGCYALIFILTGGIGNVIDRICRGYVVDMFDFTLIDFAVFNVADTFVTCGSLLFVIMYLITKGDMIKWN